MVWLCIFYQQGGYMIAVAWYGTGFNECDTRNPHGGEGYVRHNIMRTVV